MDLASWCVAVCGAKSWYGYALVAVIAKVVGRCAARRRKQAGSDPISTGAQVLAVLSRVKIRIGPYAVLPY